MKKFLLLMIAGLLIFSAQAEVSQVKKAMIAAIIVKKPTQKFGRNIFRAWSTNR